MKKTFLLFAVLLAMQTGKSFAQTNWWINPNNDLESNIPSGPPYINVVVDNNLGVHMPSPAPLAISYAGGPATIYPLTVNGTTVLWSSTGDVMRNIFGLSLTGGISMLTGNTQKTGSGLILNSYNASTNPGLIQTLSYGNTSAAPYAYEHINWNNSTSLMESMFSIDHKRNTRITGNIMLDFPTVSDQRNIEGLTTTGGITLFTGTAGSTSTQGTTMAMNSQLNPSTPGLIQMTAVGPTVLSTGTVGLAYNLMTSQTSGTYIKALQINNNGNTRIGNYAAPTLNDRLTIDGNLYLNSTTGADNTARNIYARSALGSLNITSGNQTDGSDGACMTAYAFNSAVLPGTFAVKSNQSGANNDLGFSYSNYSGPTGGPGTNTNIFLLSKKAVGIVGLNVALNEIANNDVFTVKTALGMYSDNDADEREIHGETQAGSLAIGSYTDNTTGSSIYLYGQTNTAHPGQITLNSYGTTGSSIHFTNYDGSVAHNNVTISNTGQTIIGKDLDYTAAATGDVLTVKTQLGFNSTGNAQLNGNRVNNCFTISANTNSSNGGTIEMYGPNDYSSGSWDYDRRGMLRYLADADGLSGNTYGHIFYNYYSSDWHPCMAMTHGGKMIIGEDLINAQQYMTSNNYDLYVQNGILTEQVRVALHTTADWADYVFAKDYKLMPITKVEEFVKANNHLPDVPSAEEVKNEGIDVATMDAKLLQKVEELTLYVIEQQKQINKLQKQIDEKRN